jgi:cation transporter-like permease
MSSADQARRARKVLAWGLSIGAVLAAVGSFIGYRVTGTFLGAAAGFFTIAIVSGLAQFVLVVVAAVRGMRHPD